MDTLLKVQSADIAQVLRPKFIVLDEFDQMLTDKKYLQCLTKVLNALGSSARGKWLTDENIDRKVS